jgi:hypothetical protein
MSNPNADVSQAIVELSERIKKKIPEVAMEGRFRLFSSNNPLPSAVEPGGGRPYPEITLTELTRTNACLDQPAAGPDKAGSSRPWRVLLSAVFTRNIPLSTVNPPSH